MAVRFCIKDELSELSFQCARWLLHYVMCGELRKLSGIFIDSRVSSF